MTEQESEKWRLADRGDTTTTVGSTASLTKVYGPELLQQGFSLSSLLPLP